MERTQIRIEIKDFKNAGDVEIDPLDEYSPLEKGIRCFCRDRNCHIELQVGEERLDLDLFDDVLPELDSLPHALASLSRGESFELGFGELCTSLVFSAQNNEVMCKLKTFGYEHIQKEYTLDRRESLETLGQFVNSLIKRAVQEGFVRQADAECYVGPLREAFGEQGLAYASG
jgi:hypothetical protein